MILLRLLLLMALILVRLLLIMLLWLMIIFLVLVARAFWPSRKAEMESHGQIPLRPDSEGGNGKPQGER